MQSFTTKTTEQRDRILIADDADIGRKLLNGLLRKEYDVIEARNGLEVVQILRSDPGQLACILLDVMMPVMDGIKVMQFMKENDLLDSIPVVALTAISDADGKIACYEAGALDIIEKPIDNKLFIYKVRHIINKFRRQHDIASQIGSGDLDYVQSVLDSLPFAVFVRDAATRRIKYCNAIFQQIPGCPENPVGATVDSFFQPSMLMPMEHAADDLLVRRIQTPAELDDPVTGQHYSVIFNALQNENGIITDLIGAIINTTAEVNARRQLEERLRMLSLGKAMP